MQRELKGERSIVQKKTESGICLRLHFLLLTWANDKSFFSLWILYQVQTV